MHTTDTIFIAHTIAAPVQDVFKAFTTKKGYHGWWARVCDIDCAPNGCSSIRFVKPHVTEEMIFKAIEVIENEKLLWTCTANNVFPSWIGSTLSFSVQQRGSKTLFTFTQMATVNDWEAHADFDDSLAGWEFFLASLKQYCETGKGNAWG